MQPAPPQLIRKIRSKRPRRYPAGQIMLYQADVPIEVLVLKSGVVKMYDCDASENEKILQLMRPWAILPLAFFSGDKVATRWFYSALTDCEVYVLPVNELTEMMRQDPDLTFQLMHWFSQEAHELLVRLSSMGRTTVRLKIEAALQFLATYYTEPASTGPWRRVTFPVNHQLLANMTGITRESVATTMRSLQKDRVSRSPRQSMLEINIGKLSEPPPLSG